MFPETQRVRGKVRSIEGQKHQRLWWINRQVGWTEESNHPGTNKHHTAVVDLPCCRDSSKSIPNIGCTGCQSFVKLHLNFVVELALSRIGQGLRSVSCVARPSTGPTIGPGVYSHHDNIIITLTISTISRSINCLKVWRPCSSEKEYFHSLIDSKRSCFQLSVI